MSAWPDFPATHLDLYQLTSLVPHWDRGLSGTPVVLRFFSRELPRGPDARPARGYVLWVGLAHALHWLEQARLDEERLGTLLDHPLLGPALRRRPGLVEALRRWRFRGQVRAPAEGTPLWMGPAVTEDGAPLAFDGVRFTAQCPYLEVETDLLSAKLIETPLLSLINHLSMVATKASRVVRAAGERPVAEFGTRRTHPLAAVDAAYAAWIAGCAGTSNVEAHHRWGIPLLGTMDHFAVQAWERPGVPRHESERAFFRAFFELYPRNSWLLVDTYDPFGPLTGIPNAVAATGGRLTGIRLDSALSAETARRARALLDRLGAPRAKILFSGGLDERAIRELGDAPVDGFGVGERMVSSADAPVGVGAVAKLVEVGGRPSTKLSRGSAKAHLPGRLQVFRQDGVDRLVLEGERAPGEPLLRPVWEGERPLPLPAPAEVREHARRSLAALPPERLEDGPPPPVRVSPGLARLARRLLREGLGKREGSGSERSAVG